MSSNAEKQARFRKKEALKRFADEVFRKLSWRQGANPTEMRAFLDNAINLPSGWTDEQWEHAKRTIEIYASEIHFYNPHQLINDVYDGRDSRNEFRTTAEPAKLIKEEKIAVEKARTLAAHLISALELSDCPVSDQAAVLMEVVRHVGRLLLANPKVPKSKATTMCLASVGPQYERPDWFTESLAEILTSNLYRNMTHDIAAHLK